MHLSLTILTACDDGDPSATESTRRKAFNLDEISENKKFRRKVELSGQSDILSNNFISKAGGQINMVSCGLP